METIPEITNPLGRSWQQPDLRKIKLNDEYAEMDEQTLQELLEYSRSMPTGVYEGKMWRAMSQEGWLLCWYAPSKNDENYCSVKRRRIQIVSRELGEHCQSCGRPYLLVWYASDLIWNKVIGSESGLRCPDCFNAECEKLGIFLRWTAEEQVKE